MANKYHLLSFSLLLIATCFISFSCKKDTPAPTPVPTVDFNYSGANKPAPATVSFSNYSTNSDSYFWDFGDNGTSSEQNPNHTFLSGGVYTVKLSANGSGGSSSTTKTLNIGAAFTKVSITQITLTLMPFIDGNGAGWDPSDGPDVYFKISDLNNVVLYDATSASRFNNVTLSSLPIAWNLSTPFLITDFNAARFIDLWDYDTLDPDDNIGYVGFRMSDYITGSNPYPSIVTKTQNGITILLSLSWQ
ncbi:MAG: PKD domain-containing protein [Bacteroidales bacterium]